MAVMIQVRNVPESLHRKLKARAALAGQSLSDYLLREIEGVAAEPTFDEWLAELERDPPTNVQEPIASVLHQGREERTAALTVHQTGKRSSRRSPRAKRK